jgi:hypothetical protein
MLLVVGVIGVVFALAQGLSIAYRYYDLRNQITYILGSAEITPDLELKKRVLGVIKGARMSSNEQDIVLERAGEQVRAELPYRHDIELLVAGKQLRLASIPVTLVVERRLTQARGKFVVDAPERSAPVQSAPVQSAPVQSAPESR